MIKNALPNKSGNPKSLKKKDNSNNYSNVQIVGEYLLRVFYNSFCLRLYFSSD